MAAAGSADGAYKLGSLDRGFELTLDRALRTGVRQCALSLRAAITALTWIPARALGLDDRLGRLAPGYAADAVLLNGALEVSAVWGAGRRLA